MRFVSNEIQWSTYVDRLSVLNLFFLDFDGFSNWNLFFHCFSEIWIGFLT